MGEDKVLFDVVDGVGAVTFNRPDEANAMDLDLMRQLMRIYAPDSGGRHHRQREVLLGRW